MKTFWLSLHAPYQCRHAGACCSSGWPIPLEWSRAGAIQQLRGGRAWLRPAASAPDDIAGILATTTAGRCVFHQTQGQGCEIQHALGHDALPSACQHFPRECLIDRRGVSVTLSHYCPTAADLLFTHAAPVRIIEGPSPLPHGHPEGLDARDALPPSLTPALLMDDESYAAWEAHMIARLAGEDVAASHPLERRIAALGGDARRLSRWRPRAGALIDEVRGLAHTTTDAAMAHEEPDWDLERRLFAIARAALPDSTRWPDAPGNLREIWRVRVAPEWRRLTPVVARFAAGHAFGSWMAYQGNALLSVVHRIHLALAVLRVEAARCCEIDGATLDPARLKHSIRQTDLLVVHLAQRAALARLISSIPA